MVKQAKWGLFNENFITIYFQRDILSMMACL